MARFGSGGIWGAAVLAAHRTATVLVRTFEKSTETFKAPYSRIERLPRVQLCARVCQGVHAFSLRWVGPEVWGDVRDSQR